MIRVLIFLSLSLPPIGADNRRGEKRADDGGLSGMEEMLQQQATMLQVLQAGQGALGNRIIALEKDNAGLKGQLSQVEGKLDLLSTAVAFTVRFKMDNVAHGIALGSGATLRFDDVVFNGGNGYSPHTGRFTAPVAGTYSFFLTQMGAGAHSNMQLAIAKTGAVLDNVYSHNHEDQGSSQVTTHLRAQEQVWVQQRVGDAVRGAWYTLFSGYLLQADLQ